MKSVSQINRGCIRKIRSDRMLTANTRYVLGWAASGEFGGEVNSVNSLPTLEGFLENSAGLTFSAVV